MVRRYLPFTVAAVAALASSVTPALGAITLRPLITGASLPVYVTHAGDRRLFIVELPGRILIYDRNSRTLQPTPFLDIRNKVALGGERGLLSLAFHPDYRSKGR